MQSHKEAAVTPRRKEETNKDSPHKEANAPHKEATKFDPRVKAVLVFAKRQVLDEDTGEVMEVTDYVPYDPQRHELKTGDTKLMITYKDERSVFARYEPLQHDVMLGIDVFKAAQKHSGYLAATVRPNVGRGVPLTLLDRIRLAHERLPVKVTRPPPRGPQSNAKSISSPLVARDAVETELLRRGKDSLTMRINGVYNKATQKENKPILLKPTDVCEIEDESQRWAMRRALYSEAKARDKHYKRITDRERKHARAEVKILPRGPDAPPYHELTGQIMEGVGAGAAVDTSVVTPCDNKHTT